MRAQYGVVAVDIDATNFFTDLSGENPARLPRPGDKKAGRHDKRQVPLFLAVTSPRAMPLVHLTDAGNVANVHVFPHVHRRLMERVRRLDPEAAEITLVFDRGQNWSQNLAGLADQGAYAVGGLIASQHPYLLRLDVKAPTESVGDLRVLKVDRVVYGQKAAVVVRDNDKLEKKRRLTLPLHVRAR